MLKRLRGLTKRQRRMVLWVNVLLVAGFGVWHFGVAALFVLETRFVAWKSPVVKNAPVELKDLSVSQAPGTKLSYFGYEFEVPWEDLDEEKTKQTGKMQLIGFRSGNKILFSRAAPKEFVRIVLSNPKADQDALRIIFGEEALQSDYAMRRLILETTPGQVTLLTPRGEAARSAMLLVMKGVMVPKEGETGIFRVRAGEFQGFQFGDPARWPKSIDVDIFAEDGGLGFVFSQKEEGPVSPIAQAEINRVIQTVHRIPEQDLSASH